MRGEYGNSGGEEGGEAKKEATAEMLAVLREGNWGDASQKVVELQNRKMAPQSVWDALFQHAGEMLMRRPGIVSLHACTATNAMHYAHRQTFNMPLLGKVWLHRDRLHCRR